MRSHKARYIIVALGFIVLAFPARIYSQPPNPPLDMTPDRSVGVLSEDPGYGERWSTSIFPFGNYVGPDTGQDVFCRTYLRFPLDAIPAGSVIQSATLFVFVDDYWPGPGSAPMSVYPVAADWTPESVDWYDMAAWPPLDGAVATTAVSSDRGWFTWDVTALVREWASGARPNYGLALAAVEPNQVTDNWAAARRLSANEPGTQPRLFVAYIAPTATPGGPPPTATPLPPTVVPQPSATPQPAAATATPTPIPILLPETGGTSAEAACWPLGIWLMTCILVTLMARRHQPAS